MLSLKGGKSSPLAKGKSSPLVKGSKENVLSPVKTVHTKVSSPHTVCPDCLSRRIAHPTLRAAGTQFAGDSHCGARSAGSVDGSVPSQLEDVFDRLHTSL